MKTLTIIFTNNTNETADICLFQQDQNFNTAGVLPLAWFSEHCGPSQTGTFKWTGQYSFYCGDTGPLKPGMHFLAFQRLNAGLNDSNTVTFDYNRFSFFMQDIRTEEPLGSLCIKPTGRIPINEASIAIGLSGAPTFATQAIPNTNLVYTPNPTYYMAWGNYRQSDVLDVAAMNNIIEVPFPQDVTTMYVTLNFDKSWSVAVAPIA